MNTWSQANYGVDFGRDDIEVCCGLTCDELDQWYKYHDN